MGSCSKSGKILNISFLVGVLDDGAKKHFRKFNCPVVSKNQFDSKRQSAGFNHIDGLWEKRFGNKKLVSSCFYGCPRPRIESHDHGLCGGGAFVEQ